MSNIGDVCRWLDSFAPRHLAADWDNTGLLLGSESDPCTAILCCLTVTREVAEEAIDGGYSLIVSHHPILFKATKSLSASTRDGALPYMLARSGVAVYSPHTSFDNCRGGINDFLADALGLADVRPLRPKSMPPMCKVVAFVPVGDLEAVREAMFAAGAGRIGDYERCSFRTPGTGTFFGTDSTHPAVGQKGRLETVEEVRLEVVCPTGALHAVVRAMRAAHSYEEPAFDIYPLAPSPSREGEGRIGELPEPVPLGVLAERFKVALNSRAMQRTPDADRPVQRVALACGAAGEFLDDAIRENADLFVTGEMRFHDALTARERGISLLLPGHYDSERPAVERLAARLREAFAPIPVRPSERETIPLVGI